MNVTDSVLTRPSVCPLDCPDTCSLAVATDGAHILDVRGSTANPYTAGVICNKVARSYPEFVHGSGRLTRPLKRVGRRGGDGFTPIPWTEALDLIHESISGAVARHGPQTVLPLNYAGPHGELAGGSMDRRFFHRLGASLLARGQLCGIVRGSAYASLYGAAPGMPPEQIRHSDLVVVWGNNVTVSNLHLAREIQAARKGADARLIVVDPKRTPDLVPEGTRTVNIVDVSRLLLDDTLDPPIKAVFIYNHNPVATHPDQNRMRRALAREDVFVAGADVVMTDSMRYCDVVLPAASHFEFADIYGAYGHRHLQRAEAVIPPVGESLPNTEIFRRLAARFGFDDPMFRESDETLMDAAFVDDDPRLAGHRPCRLPVGLALAMTTVDGAEPMMCATVRPATDSGRIELFSRDLEDRFGYGLPRYEPVEREFPLTIISPSSAKRTNATFGNCALSGGSEEVEINPADAGPRGISDGDALRVYNDRGETRLVARTTDAVLPGVLYTPKGVWLAGSPTGQTVNALLDADIRTDIEDGACCNEAFCEVARVV